VRFPTEGPFLGEAAAAVLETIARFLPEEPRAEKPRATSHEPRAGRPKAAGLKPEVRSSSHVAFHHPKFGTEMAGLVLKTRADGRLVVRPLAQWWGQSWQRITYTRTVVLRPDKVRPVDFTR
jgi:hypothetical protein